MYSLRLFGGFALLDPSGRKVQGLTQRRAEAVLALVAHAGELGCSRDRIIGLLWSESADALARHSLRDVLYGLRQTVHVDLVRSTGDTLTLNPAIVSSDVGRFALARDTARLADAVQEYRGPFLDGFHVDDSPEYELWCEDERARLRRECAEMMESLAVQADSAGDWSAAATWWQRAADHDPHNSRLALRLMDALAAAGDRANALMRAESHRRRLWQELEIEPDAQFTAAEARLRQENGGANGTGLHSQRSTSPASPSSSNASGESPDGSTTPVPAPAPPSAGPRRRLSRRTKTVVASLTLLGAFSAAPVWRWTHRPPPTLDRDAVAVVPFSWGGHATLKVEAQDLWDEVTRELLDGSTPRAVNKAAVSQAWHRARGDDERRDPHAVDADVATGTNASLVLRGSLDSAAAGRLLTFTLVRMPTHRMVAQRSVLLGSDTSWSARRLLMEVLALEAGEPEHRLKELARHPSRPVRIYLSNMRRANALRFRFETVNAVWALDSTFVYPGLFCFLPVGFYDPGPEWVTLAQAVWRRRDVLVPEDRAFANAAVGPWFGLADNAEQRIELWRAAAAAAPRWWLPTAIYTLEFMNYGSRTTLKGWRAFMNGWSTFDRELQMALAGTDSSWKGVVELAFWHGVFNGDSSLARRALGWGARLGNGRLPGQVGYVYYWFSSPADWPWIFDAAFGSAAKSLRVDPDTLTDQRLAQGFRSARVLALAQPRAAAYADSFAVTWQRRTADRPADGLEMWVGWHWRTRGDFARWVAMSRRDYLSGWSKRTDDFDEVATDAMTIVKDALYLGAPTDTLVRRAVARLQRMADNDSSPSPPVRARGMAHCWAAQWRLAHGDTTGVSRAIAALRQLDADDRAGRLDGLPGSGRWIVCPALLEAQRARLLGRGALEKARALDRLLRPMPTPRRSWWAFGGYANHDGLRPFIDNYLAAQLLAAAGDTAAALAAVQRKPSGSAFQLDFFDMASDHLRLEGRFAAAMADTVEAVAAYEQYLALRSNPPAHPPWRAAWDSVRAELARLKPRS